MGDKYTLLLRNRVSPEVNNKLMFSRPDGNQFRDNQMSTKKIEVKNTCIFGIKDKPMLGTACKDATKILQIQSLFCCKIWKRRSGK